MSEIKARGAEAARDDPMTNLITHPSPSPSPRGRALTAMLVATLVAGCASTKGDESAAIGEAATRPLQDVGLLRVTPPAALEAVEKAPYAVVEGATCEMLAAEIEALDPLLGPDIDLGPEAADGLVEDLVTRAIGGLVDIPFRGVVRRVSGADARDREMRRAKLAGQLRRAFLKGLGRGRQCPGRG